MKTNKYPLVKDEIATGNLTFIRSVNLGLGKLMIYTQKSKFDDEKCNVRAISGFNFMGCVVFGLLRILLTPIYWLLNIINKDLGPDVFGRLFEDIDDTFKESRGDVDIGPMYQLFPDRDITPEEARAKIDTYCKELKTKRKRTD